MNFSRETLLMFPVLMDAGLDLILLDMIFLLQTTNRTIEQSTIITAHKQTKLIPNQLEGHPAGFEPALEGIVYLPLPFGLWMP